MLADVGTFSDGFPEQVPAVTAVTAVTAIERIARTCAESTLTLEFALYGTSRPSSRCLSWPARA